MRYPSNPKLCWMMALDSGVRSQQSISFQHINDDKRLLKTERRVPCYVELEQSDGSVKKRKYYRDQMISTESCSRKGGEGAGVNADFTPFHTLILWMERNMPKQAAICHVLCHPDESGWFQGIRSAESSVFKKFADSEPKFYDKRVWSLQKSLNLSLLIKAALWQARLNVSGEIPPWGCEKVALYINGPDKKEPIKLHNWARDWADHWEKINDIITDLEKESLEPVYNLLKHLRKQDAA